MDLMFFFIWRVLGPGFEPTRGKTLCRLLDPYDIQSMVTCPPGLTKYLPQSQDTYYSNCNVPIDIECMKKLEIFMLEPYSNK